MISEFNALWVGSSLGAKSISRNLATSLAPPNPPPPILQMNALFSSPYIAGDATSQPITIVIYLYERRTAAVAATGHESQSSPKNVLREIG